VTSTVPEPLGMVVSMLPVLLTLNGTVHR